MKTALKSKTNWVLAISTLGAVADMAAGTGLLSGKGAQWALIFSNAAALMARNYNSNIVLK